MVLPDFYNRGAAAGRRQRLGMTAPKAEVSYGAGLRPHGRRVQPFLPCFSTSDSNAPAVEVDHD